MDSRNCSETARSPQPGAIQGARRRGRGYVLWPRFFPGGWVPSPWAVAGWVRGKVRMGASGGPPPKAPAMRLERLSAGYNGSLQRVNVTLYRYNEALHRVNESLN